MKKALFLLLILPLIGFSQNLATWNTTTPTSVASNMTAQAFTTAGGVSVQQNQWEAYGFIMLGWHVNGQSSTAINTSKYLEFTAAPQPNYKISPSQFKINLNSSDKAPAKMEVRASVDGTTWTSLTNNANGQTVMSLALQNDLSFFLNFPSNYNVLPGETLRIRVYMYDSNDIYYTKNYLRTMAYSNGNAVGPTLTGTVASYSSVMSTVADTYNVLPDQASTLSVITNDNNSASITSISIAANPLHGTAVANPNKKITYTPTPGYIGADSFSYTATNGTTSSTATVTLSVLNPTPSGALSGTYLVGTGGNFATITAAVAHINTQGVAGPVTFLLNNDVYNVASGESFPITINQFPGTSLINTVTFKPGLNKTVSIEAANLNDYTGIPAIFKLNGADNIIFDGSNTTGGTTRNLTVNNKDYITYVERTVFWIASNGSNAATNVMVKNTNVRMGSAIRNQGGKFCVGLYSGNNATGDNNTMVVAESTANNANITVKNNDFMNVKQGVYINGGSTLTTNVIIHQNDLGSENNAETIIQPSCVSNVNGFEFTENLIYNLYRSNADGSLVSSGIYVKGNSSAGMILKNSMRNLTKSLDEGIFFAGIVLESTNTASNILVANNFILNVSGVNVANYKGSAHGIVVAAGGGYKIYHNTVALNTSAIGSGIGYSAALYVENGVNLDVRNNIFANNQTNTATRRTAIAVKATNASMSTIFSNLNYNDYFSTDKIAFVANQWSVGDIESYNSPDYLTTLSAWKSLTGKDANTVNVSPVFSSATDLHLPSSNSGLNGLGTPLAIVLKDIDGQLRNTTTPDMGADEFGAIEMPTPGSNAGIYCASSTTWNGTAWSNGAPTAEKDAIFTGNFTQNGGVFTACSMFVTSTAQVNFMSMSNAIITHNVNIAETASLTFESSSNLIQLENTQNVGTATIKRKGSKLKRLDYTMWSSPVTGTQSLSDFSPATMANRFYVYNTPTNEYLSVSAAQTFSAAKGYLIRMPNEITTPQNTAYIAGGYSFSYEGVFAGTPNNGNVYIPLVYTETGKYNAVGNPYPSPISVTDFIDANLDNIEGTLWVWRKTNNPLLTSYCTITKIGYTANSAPGGGANGDPSGNDLIADPFTIDPNGVLNTGQGFIVKSKSNQNIVFRNNMRKAANFANFFRTTEDAETTQTPSNAIVGSRIWINVSNTTDSFSQTLIGYTSQATLGYDNGIDGKTLAGGDIEVYTMIDDLKLTIQGRPAFNSSDVVPLGFKTTSAGSFEFTLDHMNGLFEGEQEIYIKDNTTGSVHNLKDSNYAFSSEAGTFEGRFEVVYTTSALSVEAPVAIKDIVVYREGSQIKAQSPQDMKAVTVYDVTGKVIYQNNNVNAAEFTTSALTASQQMVIVNITLDNNQTVSKKIMMN